jgi:hypothetical protein
MARLGHVLNGHAGLVSANATLTGEVTLTYDDELTSRAALLSDMQRGGFRAADGALGPGRESQPTDQR